MSERTRARFVAMGAIALVSVAGALAACSGASPMQPAGAYGTGDAGAGDVATPDAGTPDAGAPDAADGGTPDAGTADASPDASPAGPPTLVALGVTGPAPGDAGAPITLVPPFSPQVHDYYVRCEAGDNVLTVSMTASDGASGLLVQPTTSPSLPQQSLSVSVAEGQAIVAAATDGEATAEYWVRCLPHDFPQLQWTPHLQAGATTPGYYLVGSALQTTTSGCYAMVLDDDGVPVWYSKAEPGAGWCVFDVDDAVSGAISFDSVVDSPSQFEIHQLSPLATTRIASPPGVNIDLHDFRPLPNGDYLVISSPLQSGVDLTGMVMPQPTGGTETLSGPQTIMACDLVELKPDGTIAWSWSATDHFDAVKDSVAPTLTPYGPENNSLVIDPFHCNSIDVDPGNGNLLVSAREMSSIFYIEKSTGKVLWKMGGATYSKDGATYVSVADPFALQHDARFQPDWSSASGGGSGHISLFDDESYTTTPARAVVYDVAVGDAGATGTATVSWQYKGATSSVAMGSFRIMPDGSRVIGWGLVQGGGFTEVDAAGDDLLDFAFADSNTTYRAIKVPLGAYDLGVLRSTAGV